MTRWVNSGSVDIPANQKDSSIRPSYPGLFTLSTGKAGPKNIVRDSRGFSRCDFSIILPHAGLRHHCPIDAG